MKTLEIVLNSPDKTLCKMIILVQCSTFTALTYCLGTFGIYFCTKQNTINTTQSTDKNQYGTDLIP